VHVKQLQLQKYTILCNFKCHSSGSCHNKKGLLSENIWSLTRCQKFKLGIWNFQGFLVWPWGPLITKKISKSKIFRVFWKCVKTSIVLVKSVAETILKHRWICLVVLYNFAIYTIHVGQSSRSLILILSFSKSLNSKFGSFPDLNFDFLWFR
jgi:hypothetical protein